jgi:hypothetical protein
MKNKLAIIVDMFRHDTSCGRNLLSLLSGGPPTRKPSVLEKACVGRKRGEQGSSLWSLPFFLLVQAVV